MSTFKLKFECGCGKHPLNKRIKQKRTRNQNYNITMIFVNLFDQQLDG